MEIIFEVFSHLGFLLHSQSCDQQNFRHVFAFNYKNEND